MTVSVDDSKFVRELVRDQSSISLGENKEYLIEARLAPLARREGLDSIAALIDEVRAGRSHLRDEVVGALATHETWFFRDHNPFEALREVVIPALLADDPGRRLALWSAAASTGQEAYSLAMLLLEHFPGAKGASILATDLSADVLDRAGTGSFNQFEVNRGLPAPFLVKYFERQGLRWQLHDRVRSLVSFRQMNLAEPLPSIPPMDIVFLRNVLIYFEPETRAGVLERINRVLRPGGYLFLGSTETTYGLDAALTRVRLGTTTCYQRNDGRVL